MPPFSFLRNITNLPTYPINQQSNLLQQNESPQNCSTVKHTIPMTGLTPVNTTLQYPTRTPTQPIQRPSIAPPPSPTLSHQEINITGSYHIQSDKENPNDIRHAPNVSTPNLTDHGQPANNLITQSNLNIRTFQYAWRVPLFIVLRTTRGHYFEL
ncbi:hypothetical protein AX16_007847 [Volvariella volvacea WC 439]|nr:hypothetical protein AX16_007847 [Volvariella volvacea WC 439]